MSCWNLVIRIPSNSLPFERMWCHHGHHQRIHLIHGQDFWITWEVVLGILIKWYWNQLWNFVTLFSVKPNMFKAAPMSQNQAPKQKIYWWKPTTLVETKNEGFFQTILSWQVPSWSSFPLRWCLWFRGSSKYDHQRRTFQKNSSLTIRSSVSNKSSK